MKIHTFTAMQKPKVLVIVGPTASGKTSLGIELAKQFNGEIISADSRQVYRGLDLGTGKVTKEEMGGIPHHLLDIANPTDVYTVADFVRDGRTAIDNITSRGKLPIIVGGTFFYIDALLGRIVAPHVLPNETLREKLEQMNLEELTEELTAKDPRRAKDIDTKNKRRLIRALEIVDALGFVPEEQTEELYDALTIGIKIEKEILHERIHKRLLERIQEGMIDEVKRLHEQGLPYERMEDLGLEYRYIARFLEGQLSMEDMQKELETKIRQFAKRQMTWLRRDTEIIWIEKDKIEEIKNIVRSFLKILN